VAAGDLNLIAADPMKQVTDPWRNHPNFSNSPDCVFRGGALHHKKRLFLYKKGGQIKTHVLKLISQKT
jgi:hypothetical protein